MKSNTVSVKDMDFMKNFVSLKGVSLWALRWLTRLYHVMSYRHSWGVKALILHTQQIYAESSKIHSIILEIFIYESVCAHTRLFYMIIWFFTR
jgi:hypothetical protein